LVNKERNKYLLHTQTEKGTKKLKGNENIISLPMTSITVQESALSERQ
jgi:hypothetical protein